MCERERESRVVDAHVFAHPGNAHACRGERPRTRLHSVVLGMTRKTPVCKCDIFSPLSGNLPQKDFLRRAEAMHARWADIRARPRLVPDRKHPSAAAGPFSRTRMRRFYDATILGLRSPPRARRGGGGKNSLTTNMGVAGSVKYRSLHYFDSDILPGLVSSNEHFLPTGNI